MGFFKFFKLKFLRSDMFKRYTELRQAWKANKGLPPRNWRAELYEYFIEHNLSIKNYDTYGFTEKLTIAWCTPTARLKRALSNWAWGPYGIFAKCYREPGSLMAALKVEFGTWLVASGFAGLFIWPSLTLLWVALALVGVGIILWVYPQIDFWDVSYEIWLKPTTWPDLFNTHAQALADGTLKKKLDRPLRLQVLPCDTCAYHLKPEVDSTNVRSPFDGNPEWLSLLRREKINLIAEELTNLVSITNTTEETLFPEDFEAKDEIDDFDLFPSLDDLLLLNAARSPHGLCEFFFSFAFWAPRTIRSRGPLREFWGPLKMLYWPYISLGAPLREILASAYCWLISISSILLVYSFRFGPTSWIIYTILTVILVGSLVGFWAMKHNIEDWYGHDLLEAIPPARPYNTIGARKRYKLLKKSLNKPRYFTSFVLYWLFIVVYFNCWPMRLNSFYEAFGLVFLWSLLSFLTLDEEPVFDFSDWNLTHICLLGLGFFSFVWENILRARSGAYVYKDLVLLYATFFYVYSLERYMQAIQIVFFCHCLAPLEVDLMDSVEVFLEYFSLASIYISVSITWLILLSLVGFLGATSLATGRLLVSRLCSSVICVGLAMAWLLVGWDLSINSLSLIDVTGGSDLLYSHSPTSLTYNAISNNADQFDWHKEQTRPFMVRFEVFYLFAMQLFLFVSLGLSAWVWGLIAIDNLSATSRAITFWGLGLRNLTHVITTNVISFTLLGLPYLRVLIHVPYEYFILG